MKTLFLALFLVSCGDSPLLNHTMERTFQRSQDSRSAESAYRFSKVPYSFNVVWEVGPMLGTSKFTLKTWNTETGTFQGPFHDIPNELYIFLWMPAMGHGSSPVKVKQVETGVYEVSDVYFLMGGKWEIKFQVKESGRVLDEVIVPLTL